jgi:uncharacterized alkaline shock family protein YloU
MGEKLNLKRIRQKFKYDISKFTKIKITIINVIVNEIELERRR